MTEIESNQEKMDEILRKRETDRMRDLLINGLPTVYDGDFDAYLADFYPDFTWNLVDSKREYMLLLNCREWVQLANGVKDTHGYDFVSEIIEAVEEL